jgi:hypothetical protein
MKNQRIRKVLVLALSSLLAGGVSCSTVQRIQREVFGASTPGTVLGQATGTPESGSGLGEEVGVAEDVPPELSSQERIRLGYPRVHAGGTGGGPNRAINGDVFEWPEMRFLEEYELIGGVGYEPVSVRPTEIRIVRGSSIPMSYSPELDIGKPEPNGSPGWYRGSLDKPVLFIPPNASLVMVKLETLPSPGQWAGPGEYQCPDDGTRWGYRPSEFRLGYPGLGETRVELGGDFWFGDYQAPGLGCPGNGWLYFIIPGLDVDPSLLWLEYIGGTEVGQLAFWTLTERP